MVVSAESLPDLNARRVHAARTPHLAGPRRHRLVPCRPWPLHSHGSLQLSVHPVWQANLNLAL
eukprot:scaffold44873_cov42-Phaeocystis_antarctica.AAC.1